MVLLVDAVTGWCNSSKSLGGMSQFAFITLLLFLWFSYIECEDFYSLLGVSRDADNRAIRRAFKKLALVKHPDKNPVSSALNLGMIYSKTVVIESVGHAGQELKLLAA